MASASRDKQALQLAAHSQPPSRNSFSISSILNLQGESSASSAPPAPKQASCPIPRFPLVPRVVRPYAFSVEGGVPLYSPTHWLGAVEQFPPWLFGTRFTRFLPGVTPYLRRRRPLRKRKQRPLFSQQQVQTMEREFAKHRYVTEESRSDLASRLDLTETQVKTWFQNRRTKWRKETRDELETALMDSKRRWKENAEKDDERELDPQQTSSASTANASNTLPAPQSSHLFIDLDNFKLNLTKKG